MSIMLPLQGRDGAEIADLARDIAREFDLVVSVETAPPVVTVRFVRARRRDVGE